MNRTTQYRRFQDFIHRERLRRLSENSPTVVWWNNFDNPRYLKRYYYGNQFFKRQARKKTRNLSLEYKLPKGNIGHKYYDYWWTVT